MNNTKVIAVDIDGTLTKSQTNWWEYEKCVPDLEAIKKVNALDDGENIIIMYSARFEEDREVTKRWLRKYGVKYHKLVLDKLRANLYIDNDSKRIEDLSLIPNGVSCRNCEKAKPEYEPICFGYPNSGYPCPGYKPEIMETDIEDL